jgi:hypothetical protein
MPTPGKLWRHIVIGTHGSWLPGDPRGWRSRNHKRHSSGDYRDPPSPGEHAGLYEHSQRLCPKAVTLPRELLPVIGAVFLENMSGQGMRTLAVALSSQHLHALVELPVDVAEARRVVGICKLESSRAVTQWLPGRIWAAGGNVKPVVTREHQRRAFCHILDHAAKGAWTWSYRDGEGLLGGK